MRGTRRYWRTVAVGGVLAAGALVLARPLLLGAAVAVWGWLLVRALVFRESWRAVARGLRVEQTVSDAVVRREEPVETTLTVALDAPGDVRLTVRSLPPLSAPVPTADRTVQLAPGERTAGTTYRAEVPVAGRTRLRGVRVTIDDPAGLFSLRRTLRDDALRPGVDVRPYGAADVHVGAGDADLSQGYGEHDAERGGGGVVPFQAREYVPGDALSRVDWNATARLGEPYVREFETSASRRVLLVVDHRHETGRGPAGRTMLDHGRAVATAVVEAARGLNDPLGWVTVGDGGVTAYVGPGGTTDRYDDARRAVERLSPTAPVDPTDGDDGERAAPTDGTDREFAATARTTGRPAPTDRVRAASALAGDETAFGRALGPFFTDPTRYAHRVGASPLSAAVRTATRRGGAATWPVIVTTDRNRSELVETVRAARRGDNRVLVFVTPSALFDAGADPETAYERYRSFAAFRRRLNGHDRVTALEVGPRDRIADVVGARAATDGGERG